MDTKSLPKEEIKLTKPELDLPKPQTDLPLPEKELLSPKITEQKEVAQDATSPTFHPSYLGLKLLALLLVLVAISVCGFLLLQNNAGGMFGF